MAGIAKIASKDLDEVNKINSAVLIGLGTAVVGEVKTGSTFYAGSTVLKTGSGTQTLNPANENVPAGYYALTTLSAVDGDLAVGNIKNGVQIFGFTGTFVGGAITHDVMDDDEDDQSGTQTRPWAHEVSGAVAAGGDLVIATVTVDCLQDTVVEAAYFICAGADVAGVIKSQMYIDGVAQGESGFWNRTLTKVERFHGTGNKAVSSGNRTVYLNCHNYNGAQHWADWAGGIFAAACKLV